MRFSSICLTVLAGTALLGAEEKVVWHKLAPKGGNVEVEFPGKAQDKSTKYGRHFALPVMGDKASYVLSYMDFAGNLDLTDKDTIKRALDVARERAAVSLKGELVTEKNITLGKYPGRAFDLSVPGVGVYRSRVYLTPKRVYQVIVVGPKELVEGATATRFLGSLKVLK
jgi:hypothetical protein